MATLSAARLSSEAGPAPPAPCPAYPSLPAYQQLAARLLPGETDQDIPAERTETPPEKSDDVCLNFLCDTATVDTIPVN